MGSYFTKMKAWLKCNTAFYGRYMKDMLVFWKDKFIVWLSSKLYSR